MKMLTHVLCLLPLALPALLAGSFALMGHAQTVPPAGGNQPAVEIGGEKVITLSRKAVSTTKPEFTSVTVAPGRGMEVLQITANFPGKGNVDVLASPDLAGAKKMLDVDDDAFGNLGYRLGAAFLVPYPNRIRGKLSADGKTLTTEWEGHTITLPANNIGKSARGRAPRHARTDPQGQDRGCRRGQDSRRRGGFRRHPGGRLWRPLALEDPDRHHHQANRRSRGCHRRGATTWATKTSPWPSAGIPTSTCPPATARRPGSAFRAASWPRWTTTTTSSPPANCCPSRGRSTICARPAERRWASYTSTTTGASLHWVNKAVTVRVMDPAAHYGVSIEGLSPEIKTIQVYAPPTKNFVAVEHQYNFADPFGKEWGSMDTGMVTLKPGQRTKWHVRLGLLVP